jgi:hypothetical protein
VVSWLDERVHIMSDFKPILDAFDRVNCKLDLILELVKAQKEEDWAKVNDVCKRLDEWKRTPDPLD